MPIKDDYEIDLTKQKSTYEIKAGVSYIAIPVPKEAEKQRTTVREDDPFKTPFREVLHNGKWYEVVGGKKDKFQQPIEYQIRVSKKEFKEAVPKSTPYFILPKELESKYGVRAKEIVITFFGNTVDDILPGNYMKFDGGGLKCIGDGETANRFNPVTGKWDGYKPICQCGYSSTYEVDKKEPIATSAPISDALQRRQYELYGGKKKDEVLVQNAWREVKVWDEKLKVVQLAPYYKNKPPCDMRSNLRFIVPELGMDICEFSFNRKEYRREVKTQIAMIIGQLALYRINIAGIPLIFKIEMITKAAAGGPKKNFPKISIHLKDSIAELVEIYGSKQLGGGIPEDVKQISDAAEDIEFDDAEVVDDDIEVDDIIADDFNQEVPAEEVVIQTESSPVKAANLFQEENREVTSEQEIEALKDMIDIKKGAGTAEKLLTNFVVTATSLEERNQAVIKFLKSKL